MHPMSLCLSPQSLPSYPFSVGDRSLPAPCCQQLQLAAEAPRFGQRENFTWGCWCCSSIPRSVHLYPWHSLLSRNPKVFRHPCSYLPSLQRTGSLSWTLEQLHSKRGWSKSLPKLSSWYDCLLLSQLLSSATRSRRYLWGCHPCFNHGCW